jgi:putative restriction endonuclease
MVQENDGRRAYLTASVKTRLHQRGFRERVLNAYRTSCAFCKLKHRELLDAAHIIPDSEPEGSPIINNGLALCKLHHAALDSLILGVTPDYIIKVRDDILSEEDGPVLQYGLKNLNGARLILPSSKSDWPDRDRLAWRYEQFRSRA